MCQHPSRQRRRRRFSVRARDDDRLRAPQELLAYRFRQRTVSNLAVEDLLQLEIAAGDGVAHDDEVEIRGDVLGSIADERRDAFRGEEVAHRRVDVLIRSTHVEPFSLQQRRQRGHCRPADADQMRTSERHREVRRRPILRKPGVGGYPQ